MVGPRTLHLLAKAPLRCCSSGRIAQYLRASISATYPTPTGCSAPPLSSMACIIAEDGSRGLPTVLASSIHANCNHGTKQISHGWQSGSLDSGCCLFVKIL